MNEQRGRPVDAEAALHVELGKPPGRMDLAQRLKQRKERQRQGVSYSGFVPPYNSQSRVFDANELRRAASQVWPWLCMLDCLCLSCTQPLHFEQRSTRTVQHKKAVCALIQRQHKRQLSSVGLYT